jgi:hypothetical protein
MMKDEQIDGEMDGMDSKHMGVRPAVSNLDNFKSTF